MLAITTTLPPSARETAEEQYVPFKPLLVEGTDFKCTSQMCYGVGPIHGVLGTLQLHLNRIVPVTRDGFIGQQTKAAAERAAGAILGLYAGLAATGRLRQYQLNIGRQALSLLQTLQDGQLSRQQIAEQAVPLTMLFRLGADAADNLGYH